MSYIMNWKFLNLFFDKKEEIKNVYRAFKKRGNFKWTFPKCILCKSTRKRLLSWSGKFLIKTWCFHECIFCMRPLVPCFVLHITVSRVSYVWSYIKFDTSGTVTPAHTPFAAAQPRLMTQKASQSTYIRVQI